MNHSAGTFPSVIAVLPAAGIGSRMQAECPKQYLTIGRRSIVEHAIHALLRHPRIERVIVAIGPEDRQFEQLPIAQDPRVIVT
ncbi:2-C-methyl-D-erythritol 4-phosphate cytidylyltransferase, partial [Klebsiella pneumoniae]